MNRSKKSSPRPILEFLIKAGLACLLVGIVVLVATPNYIGPKRSGPTWNANVCINNLRQIDAAKNEWALINNRKTNDIPTWEDIKPYLEHDKPYYKFDPKSKLPLCPSGGTYTIGKIGEPPTCSLGTTVNPPHVLP